MIQMEWLVVKTMITPIEQFNSGLHCFLMETFDHKLTCSKIMVQEISTNVHILGI